MLFRYAYVLRRLIFLMQRKYTNYTGSLVLDVGVSSRVVCWFGGTAANQDVRVSLLTGLMLIMDLPRLSRQVSTSTHFRCMVGC